MTEIIRKTTSLCPCCQKLIPACYKASGNLVYLEKTCPEHGDFSLLVCESLETFLKWDSVKTVNIPPKKPLTKGADAFKGNTECPLHCGPCENHMQTPCCVLLEITKRCNQHCPYCFAESERAIDKFEPSLLEIEEKLKFLKSLGEERPYNIQFSGGEPTVRDDLPEMLKRAKDLGFPYLQINTNGKRLALEEGYAKKLKENGASVVFLQFDSTNDKTYMALRNERLLHLKKKAIENCRKAQLPVTLVPTLVKGVNFHEIKEMMDFLFENLDIVSGIHFQPVSFFGRYPVDTVNDTLDKRVTMFELVEEIERVTDREILKDMLSPMATGHPLCGFHGTFTISEDKTITPLREDTPEEPACCCTSVDPLDIIIKDRGFVLNKWGGKGNTCCCSADSPDSFDSFLYNCKRSMFTLSSMAFQDSLSVDQERLKRCRVHVLSPDNRVIPFCSYNIYHRERLEGERK